MSNQLTIKIQMILHATENFQKITNSFFDMFGIKENEISIQNITGHFGNPISMLGLEIKNKSTREFIKKLVSMIPQDQMIGLLENIEDYIQDSSLYLRFSKQHFIKKTLILEEKDPLKIIVHTPVYVRKEIIDAYKNLLETK
jgi:RNA binding exosome subunit